MTTEDLERYIEAGYESQRIDYKASCPWSKNTFTKDILAMSNIEYGGVIIIGIKENQDGTFKRQGISQEHLSTYKNDHMLDQIARYADPYVTFRFEVAKDKNGTQFGIIQVNPFTEIPVICKEDGYDIQRGVVYYRASNGKPQSCRINSSADMRNIIERSAIKQMQKFKQLGLKISKSDEQKLTDELGDL